MRYLAHSATIRLDIFSIRPAAIWLRLVRRVIPKSTPPFSDSDRAELHKGIIAYAGTYSVDGDKVTHHVVASWRPDWIGSDHVRYIELNGKNLTIKSAPETDPTGKQIVVTLTFERVE